MQEVCNDGRTAFIYLSDCFEWACKNEQKHVVQLLLDNSKRSELNAKNTMADQVLNSIYVRLLKNSAECKK